MSSWFLRALPGALALLSLVLAVVYQSVVSYQNAAAGSDARLLVIVSGRDLAGAEKLVAEFFKEAVR